jgi:translation initiation factor eIF-2B subunit gamma
MVVRQLHALKECGFIHCVLATAHEDKVTYGVLKQVDGLQHISGNSFLLKDSLAVTLHQLPEDCAGSLQALKNIEDLSLFSPSSHVVVLPGDLVITDSSVIKDAANSHRQGYSETLETACTVLLADVGEEDENGIPLKESAKAKKNGLSREEDMIEYIGLSMDISSSSFIPRVVWKQSKIDVEEDVDMVGTTPKLVLPKPRLRFGGLTRVRTDWHDIHVYILSPWVRKLCLARPTLFSIKDDLVPLLVEAQFRGIESAFGDQEAARESFRNDEIDKVFAVRAHVFDGLKAMRASTLPAYLVACREIVKLSLSAGKHSALYVSLPDGSNVNAKFHSAIIKGAEMGDKVQIKSSVVEAGTKFGAKCKLNNVVVLANTIVGENVVLQNAVVGEGCTIGENCSLSNVRVGHGKVIAPGTKEKGDLSLDEI